MGAGDGSPAFCDRCGGELRPADLAGGLCAWCRGRVRIHEAKEAAKWAVCEGCGVRMPRNGGKPAKLCPECRAKQGTDYAARERERVRKALARRRNDGGEIRASNEWGRAAMAYDRGFVVMPREMVRRIAPLMRAWRTGTFGGLLVALGEERTLRRSGPGCEGEGRGDGR